MKDPGEILVRVPAPAAGLASGAFAVGVLAKNDMGPGFALGVLIVLACAVAFYGVWRYSLDHLPREWKAGWSAGWLTLWPLGLMLMWDRLQVPHLGSWLVGLSGGGFLWMSIWSPSLTGNRGLRIKALRWAAPAGFVAAFLWEAASGRYDYAEFLVMGQVAAAMLVMAAPPAARLSVGAGSALCVGVAALSFAASWAAHGPHCGNAPERELFECVVSGYDAIKNDDSGWRFEGDGGSMAVEVGGVSRKALVAEAPAEFNFMFDEDKTPVSFFVSMLKESWEGPGDGVRLEALIKSGGEWRKVGEKYIDPKHEWRDRAWVKVPLDVDAGGIREWKFRLYPGPRIRFPFFRKPDSNADWAAVSPEVAGDGNRRP